MRVCARQVDFAVTIGNYDARAALSALFAGAMPPVVRWCRLLCVCVLSAKGARVLGCVCVCLCVCV